MISSSEVLFVGKSNSVVSWYRTGAPAFYLGCDWCAMLGQPPHLELGAALKRKPMQMPRMRDYKVIVLQQVAGHSWQREIFKLKERGVKVLYEADDWYRGVRKIEGHAGKDIYTREYVEQMEQCMRACDGMIVSTEWLARRYRPYNKRIWVCQNSIEGSRYEGMRLPERDKLHIGWAGGEGHQISMKRWLPAVQEIMDRWNVRFISVGLPFANEIEAPGRTYALPFVPIENVPAVLCNFDIGLAPAYPNDFFRAKSDLRFLECGALGIPVIADPLVYSDIIDGKTGWHAETSADVVRVFEKIVAKFDSHRVVGEMAQTHILSERTIEKQANQWVDVFLEVAG